MPSLGRCRGSGPQDQAERPTPVLKDAVKGFLAGVPNPNTARSYATALRALTEKFGSYTPVSSL